ncbi:hypothetical protein DYI23_05730 [Roseibium polysiphoniae]|uniref:Uncharacterized protein n=1 Tax=Roseibium polysiphoniae TaxID=2571221 RepID=A0A944CCK1_9HYPH|nr:hypothetical protein [Roseibium polysiphoniae]MBS8259713.1 hypothetical protein [Roseibium polysiphoniae]
MFSWLPAGLAWLSDLIGFGLAVFLAYGGLAGATIAFASRLDPRTPKRLSSVLSVALLCVSVWNFSALHHDRQAEVDRLQAVIVSMAKQAAEWRKVARHQQELAAARLENNALLQEQIDDYDVALATGAVGACDADDEYLRRMRAIQFD